MTMSTATREIPIARRTRSDGERSRQRILEAAAQLATVQGLDRLSIGELAAHIGMSKSGLYAHFRSKEELQLATIDAAEAIFDEVVVAPMYAAKPGIPAVLALADAFLDHLGRRIFPGGCFFACASAELQSRPGPVKERIADVRRPLEGALRASTFGSPRPPATWPRARTSTRSSSRSTRTSSTRMPPSRSVATPWSSQRARRARPSAVASVLGGRSRRPSADLSAYVARASGVAPPSERRAAHLVVQLAADRPGGGPGGPPTRAAPRTPGHGGSGRRPPRPARPRRC